MRHTFTLRLALFALVSAVVVVGGASTALASMATATQNADVTVVVTLQSDGLDADQATVGNTVTASASVTNNTDRKQQVKLSRSLVGPDGAIWTKTTGLMLSPGETYSASDSLVVSSSTPVGSYTLTIAASGKNGSSSASASITVS
jgi:uncharacterized membrane protein